MEHTTRINEIVSSMKTFSKETYRREELLPELLALQAELIHLTFNGEHAKNGSLRIWDVENHFEKLIEERGHVADAALETFKEGCKVICNTIKSEYSGRTGEYKAFKSLETVRCSNTLLKNIEFNSGDRRTEIDGIMLTEKAIFLIEVKNTGRDVCIDERGNYFRDGASLVLDCNIGEKMNIKEYLVREALGTSGIDKVNIINLVVFTKSTIHVENRYPYINTCFLSDLPHIIDNYAGSNIYSDEDIAKMHESIRTVECQDAYPAPIDMKQFKLDFATVMTLLEEASEALDGLSIEENQIDIMQDNTSTENPQEDYLVKEKASPGKWPATNIIIAALTGFAAFGVCKTIWK